MESPTLARACDRCDVNKNEYLTRVPGDAHVRLEWGEYEMENLDSHKEERLGCKRGTLRIYTLYG